MSSGALETEGFVAYERDTVDRFFADAFDERLHLLTEIAGARRRIAQAKAALTAAAESELSCVRTVLDGQRALREEGQANARVIAALHADAEAQAERILQEARARASAARSASREGEDSLASQTDTGQPVVRGHAGADRRPPLHEPSGRS